MEYQIEKEEFYESDVLENFSQQILFKVMKRQSVMNSYYFMLILGEKQLLNWPFPNVTSVGNRIDSNVNLVFSTLNKITDKIFNEFSAQIEFYNSNADAYELPNIGSYLIIELPNEVTGTRKLVDDYFNYYSRKLTNSTTIILPRNFIFQAGLSFSLKNYQKKSARSEYGLIKDSVEWDEQYSLSVNLLKNKVIHKNVSLKLGILYQVNNSNNKFNQYYLYDGERFLASFGINWRL